MYYVLTIYSLILYCLSQIIDLNNINNFPKYFNEYPANFNLSALCNHIITQRPGKMAHQLRAHTAFVGPNSVPSIHYEKFPPVCGGANYLFLFPQACIYSCVYTHTDTHNYT